MASQHSKTAVSIANEPRSHSAMSVNPSLPPLRLCSPATRLIIISIFMISAPLTLFSALLIGIVFKYRLPPIQSSSVPYLSSLNPQYDQSGAYYVQFSATKLLVLASVSSSVAPLLASFFMILVSYPLARRILSGSNRKKLAELPTPSQLGLLIVTLSGGPGPLWQWLKYLRRRNKNVRTVGTVKRSFWGLAAANAFTILIIVADTWLHFATSSADFTQITPVVPPRQSSGRTLTGSQQSPGFLLEGSRTLSNISRINQLQTVNQSNSTYVILGDPAVPENVDFVASTVAINTQCVPITRECDLTTVDALWNYSCTSGFSGQYATGPVTTSGSLLYVLQYFNNPEMTADAAVLAPTTSTFYFGLFVAISDEINASSTLYSDPDIIVIPGGVSGTLDGYVYALKCTTNLYDATYVWTNNSFQSFLALSSTNATTTSVLTESVTSLDASPGGFTTTHVLDTFLLGFSNDTAQDLANQVAQEYSRLVIGLPAGAFSLRGNEEEQIRSTILVTRLPLAPYYCLIIFNSLYVIVGVIVAVISLDASVSEEGVGEVQEQLSIWGLVAHGFQVPANEQQIQNGHSFGGEAGGQEIQARVVGIVESETARNGWTFQTWKM